MGKMRAKTDIQVIIFLLLLPAFAETLDGSRFTFPIPGFPLSLGRTAFVLAGIMGILTISRTLFRNTIVRGFILIAIGIIVGGFFSTSYIQDFSRALGFTFLIVGACGVGLLWERRWLRVLLEIFFVLALVYWTYYVFGITVKNGFVSYSEIYARDRLYGTILNHHIPGIYVSVSTAFVAVRYFRGRNGLKLGGYALFGLGLITCLLLESRSNFLFTIVVFVVLLLRERNIGRFIYLATPALFVVLFALSEVVSNSDQISRRFSLADMEYQQRTTSSRFALIEMSAAAILENPFGKGVTNIKLQFDDRRFLAHNQYVTFMLAGGFVSMFGILLWMRGLFISMRRGFFSLLLRGDDFTLATLIGFFVFCVTLTTIELSGLFFFLVVSMGVYSSRRIEMLRVVMRFRLAPKVRVFGSAIDYEREVSGRL